MLGSAQLFNAGGVRVEAAERRRGERRRERIYYWSHYVKRVLKIQQRGCLRQHSNGNITSDCDSDTTGETG